MISFVDGLGPVLYVQLFVDAMNMLADGGGGDMELLGNFFVQKAPGKEVENLVLPGGQYIGGSDSDGLFTKGVDELAGYVGAHGGPALVKLF